MRRIAIALGALVIGSGALFGATGTAAAVVHPTAAKQDTVTAMQCVGGGGFVDHDDTSPTGLRCLGGQFDGIPVTLG